MEENNKASSRPGVILCMERGTTSVHIDAYITPEGDLRLYGYDVGSAPTNFLGTDDYEYWLTLPREHKDRVLLLLLEELHGRDSCAVSGFQRFLESKGVPCKFEIWR